MTAMDIANSFAPWLIFLALPSAILIGGIFSFLVKGKRLLIGGTLLLIGIMETLFFTLLIEANLLMSNYIPIGVALVTSIAVATIIIGIIRIIGSTKLKRQFQNFV